MKTLPCPDCPRLFADPAAVAQHRRATHLNPAWSAGKVKRAPTCLVCGSPARMSDGKWGTKAECCGLWSWGYKPLVDRDTHASRIRAHDAFDPLWKDGVFSRSEGYRRLALALGMDRDACHISLMSALDAKRVVDACRSGVLHRLTVEREPSDPEPHAPLPARSGDAVTEQSRKD